MHEGRSRSEESDHGTFIFAAGYRRRGMFGGFGGFGAAGNCCADVMIAVISANPSAAAQGA